MARGRMISKSLSTSKRRGHLHAQASRCPHCGGSLAEFADALYMLLVSHADDFGREPGDAFTVQHQVDPISTRSRADFERALDALVDAGLVVRYGDGRRDVLAVVDFDAHQSGLHKRTRSKFPDPPPADSIPRARASAIENKLVEREQALSHNKLVETELNRTELKVSRTFPGDSRKLPESNPTDDAPLDVWLDDLMALYPATRVTSGYLTSSAFHEQFAHDPRPAAEVWAEMRDNLANQLAGYEWRVKRMVPTLDKWLREGRWRQRHEAEPADALNDSTRRTLAAADAILRESKR